ncbi:PAS domain S-box protein [Candidatus Nitrospira salsa]
MGAKRLSNTSHSNRSDFFKDRTVLTLIFFLLLGITGILYQFNTVSKNLVESMALEETRRYTEALTQFRTLYSSEVVARASHVGVEILHDYTKHEGAIPLPATLSILIGKRLAESKGGGGVRLYSEYPFPSRTDGGPTDNFEREALRQLRLNPEEPFFQFSSMNGQRVLRYATADLMRDTCIACHNAHPQSPKTDWKVGDVRGVLEVIHPLENAVLQSKQNLQETFLIFLSIIALGIGGVLFVIIRLRRGSRLLEEQVKIRTAELTDANTSLASEVEERKQAEQALERLSQHHKNILQSAGEGIYGLDANGTTTFINQAAGKMLGYQPDELIGQPMHGVVHHSNADGTPVSLEQCRIYTALKMGTLQLVEDEVLWRKDGSSFPVSYTCTPILENDTATGAVITFKDITERINGEKALKNSSLFTEKLLSSISSILIGIDRNDCIMKWNTAAKNAFALPAEKVLGKPFLESGIPIDMQPICLAILNCLTVEKTIWLNEVTYTKPDGQEGILEVFVTPIMGEDLQISGHLILATDLTEKKQLQTQLSLVQKMESIGHLASGIAHEINTPIQFVSDNLQFLDDSFSSIDGVLTAYGSLRQALEAGALDPELLATLRTTIQEADLEYLTEEVPKAIQQSLDGTNRVAKIVRAMKEFSHPGNTQKKPTDLRHAIENTITVASNEWKYVAEIDQHLEEDLPLIPCLPGELNQVFLNIIVNATHAITDISKQNKDNKKGTIRISATKDDTFVEIRIADTGPGIPESVQHKIFDPFFTTKDVGKGTGQGLAIAHDVVVNKHQGTLTVESVQGKGTTFIIRLPIAPTSLETSDNSLAQI